MFFHIGVFTTEMFFYASLFAWLINSNCPFFFFIMFCFCFCLIFFVFVVVVVVFFFAVLYDNNLQ